MGFLSSGQNNKDLGSDNYFGEAPKYCYRVCSFYTFLNSGAFIATGDDADSNGCFGKKQTLTSIYSAALIENFSL